MSQGVRCWRTRLAFLVGVADVVGVVGVADAVRPAAGRRSVTGCRTRRS
jgi:hypothetical protein